MLKTKEHAYGGTVNSCVRLGECPSAETIVGVLQWISQSVIPVEKEASTNWQGRKAVRS